MNPNATGYAPQTTVSEGPCKALSDLAALEALVAKSDKLDKEKLLGRWAVRHLAAIRDALGNSANSTN